MIRLGLWGARGDRKGLANQTGEFALHVKPSKVMAFDERGIGWSQVECNWRDFDGLALTVRNYQRIDQRAAQEWLDGLDVVWGAETFYQDRFPTWAKDAGVATIQHVNPEFYRFERMPSLPRPTVTIAPTSWRLDAMPGVQVLPTIVNRRRCAWKQRPLSPDRVTFLHVVGARAAEDRNGTDSVIDAIRHVRVPCRVLFRAQSAVKINAGRHGCVEVETDIADRPDYWTLYDGADVLLMPRRYGGQCLPMQEAMSCGLPVIATDLEPQREWLPPQCLVPARKTGEMITQAGPIDIHRADVGALAKVMDRLAGDLDEVARLSRQADAFAQTLSWDALGPRYEAVIARAAALR